MVESQVAALGLDIERVQEFGKHGGALVENFI